MILPEPRIRNDVILNSRFSEIRLHIIIILSTL